MAVDTTGKLWHKRLYHMSPKRMWRLAKDNFIPKVKTMQLEMCTDYFTGKQNKTSFR